MACTDAPHRAEDGLQVPEMNVDGQRGGHQAVKTH